MFAGVGVHWFCDGGVHWVCDEGVHWFGDGVQSERGGMYCQQQNNCSRLIMMLYASSSQCKVCDCNSNLYRETTLQGHSQHNHMKWHMTDYKNKRQLLIGCVNCGVLGWLIGRLVVFYPKGHGSESCSGCHVGTLGKSFTHVKLCHSIRAVSGAPPSSSGLEEAL